PGAVSCPSPTFCMMLDQNANAFAFDGSAWSAAGTEVMGVPASVTALSCASAVFCLAAGGVGTGLVFTYNGIGWSAGQDVTGGLYAIPSLSCPSLSLCAGID